MWTLSVSEQWFYPIKNRRKIYEGRLFRGIPKLIRIGDKIEIWKENDREEKPIVVLVEEIIRGKNFYDMLKILPLSSVLPDVGVLEEGVCIYNQLANENSQWLYGVVFFKIKVMEEEEECHQPQ